MEGNDNLNMSLFQDNDLELNIDSIPEEYLENGDDTPDDENTDVDDSHLDKPLFDDDPEQDNNSAEDQDDPEKVGGDEDEEEGGDENNSPNLYSSLASVLHEQGLLPSLNLQDTKIENADDISNAIKGEIDSNVKARLIQALGEEGYEAVTNGVPLEQLARHREEQLTLDSIDENSLSDDLELSKKVIYQDYINQGVSPEKAQKLLQRVAAAGEEAIVEDAKESLNSIKAFGKQQLANQAEANRQAAARQAKEQDELDTKLKNTIYNSQELIKGLKLNKAIQDRIYKSITTNVGDGEQFQTSLIKDRQSNPVEFDAKLYYLYEITNGFKDLDAVMKKTTTSATATLEDSIRKFKSYDASNPTFTQDSDSYYGDGDHELVLD